MTRPVAMLSNASARGVLIAIAVFGSFALAGCASIDELKDAISRWLDTASFGDRETPPEDVPRAIRMTALEKNPKKGNERGVKKQGQASAQPADG